MLSDEASSAVANVLSRLAKPGELPLDQAYSPRDEPRAARIVLPGPESSTKLDVERELSALMSRIHHLETRAAATGSLPPTPNESEALSSDTAYGKLAPPPTPLSHTRSISTSKDSQYLVNRILSTRPPEQAAPQPKALLLTDDQLESVRDHVNKQTEQIQSQKALIDTLSAQVKHQQEQTEKALGGLENGLEDIGSLKRELAKHQQANLAFQKALREIGNIIGCVAQGDLSKKVLIHAKELDPEIATFKRTINKMIDQLQDFASQVTHLAKEVGSEGRLGGKAVVVGVSGIWAELTSSVNTMAENLTAQVREIAVVTRCVADGDLSRKIERPAKGEILQLQQTINTMVDQLRTFATEVTRVAREVGTEGRLGAQARIEGVQGMWSDLTVSVNTLADNLTTQVRDIAKVTVAVARGDLTQKVSATCKGEILDLKTTINSMVDQLRQFAHEVTKIAREVGSEGRLGGQATVDGVEGEWKDLTDNVNTMASRLTTQVREIAEVTTAVARGNLSKKVEADVQGEILALKITINSMVDRLRTFAFEVSKVAREVGTEGILGGQARVENVEGKWKDLTDNVNTMASHLTGQVRAISEVTQAIASGDMTRKIHVHAQGEILLLKSTINDMVDRLDNWSLAVKRVARDVGVDGVLGGQAQVDGIAGRWKEITVDVNTMARNLTSQVRAFAEIGEAANSGDFTQEITIAASGEMDELKRKINKMVSGLRESIEKNTKAREAAELANRSKSEFLANMSHEIRTPMNGIIGMTQLTLDSELTSYQREMLNIVHSLANSLLTIIDDILDISKIEANRMDLERIAFSMRGMVFNVLKSLAVKATERKLDLAYEVDSSMLDYLVGDSFRLRQIIVNLVGNAIKFTENGEVRVRISRGVQDESTPDEYTLLFAVSDTGIGIPADKLNLIFDTFQQADGSTTRRFGGTGLGLSISKKLVNLMGGEMWVESDFGAGSTFFFTCKLGVASTDLGAIRPMLKPFKKHTVLFIDEGHTGCKDQIHDALLQLDLTPVDVKDKEALPELPSANGHAYDCMIVDNSQTARRLRRIEKYKYIPIVMLAPVISVTLKAALEEGISSYMTTPCLPIDIGNALIPALEGRATALLSDHSKSFDILLAEDNLVNQKLAVRILEKYHHKVSVANNGLEALEAVKLKEYDIVLMDVQMPIMGGFEATGKIREWESAHRQGRTPIVALTAHAMLGDREKCLNAQMDDYLSKPLKQSHLIQTIIKCAALGGAMRDKHSARNSLVVEHVKTQAMVDHAVRPTGPIVAKRPHMEKRGVTEGLNILESPSMVTADMVDPMERLYLRSNST